MEKENICSENIPTHDDLASVTSLFTGNLDVLRFQCSVATVLLISCKGDSNRYQQYICYVTLNRK